MWLNRFCLSPIYIYECYQKNENQKLRDGEEILLSRWIYGYFQNPTLESIFKNLCCPLILKMVVKSWTEIANVGKTNFSFKISNILVFIIRVSEATIVFV